jgi:hypothetical protein
MISTQQKGAEPSFLKPRAVIMKDLVPTPFCVPKCYLLSAVVALGNKADGCGHQYGNANGDA